MSLQIFPINEPLHFKCDNATFMATLDGNRCKSESALLKELGDIFRFPEYYGHNFDALFDCLTDLEWLGVDHVYLLIIHPALICADEDNDRAREIFNVILSDVLRTFKHHPIHLHLIAEKSFIHLINPEPID